MQAMQGFEQLDFESVIQEEDKRIKNRNYNIAYINKFSYLSAKVL